MNSQGREPLVMRHELKTSPERGDSTFAPLGLVVLGAIRSRGLRPRHGESRATWLLTGGPLGLDARRRNFANSAAGERR